MHTPSSTCTYTQGTHRQATQFPGLWHSQELGTSHGKPFPPGFNEAASLQRSTCPLKHLWSWQKPRPPRQVGGAGGAGGRGLRGPRRAPRRSSLPPPSDDRRRARGSGPSVRGRTEPRTTSPGAAEDGSPRSTALLDERPGREGARLQGRPELGRALCLRRAPAGSGRGALGAGPLTQHSARPSADPR